MSIHGLIISEHTMKYKIIIFDFDGTLVISKQIKIDTYFDIFQKYDVNVCKVREVLEQFPDLNRYDTIQKIVDLTGKKLDAETLSSQYSVSVFDKIVAAKNLKFAKEVLEYLFTHNVKIHLSSNTPQHILSEIVYHRGWGKYFTSLNGFPLSKEETLKRIFDETKFAKNYYLVVGDGSSDKISALSNNMDFFEIKTNSLLPLVKYLNIDINQL